MNINVKTHHLNITDALKEYAKSKVEKLEKYYDNIQDITVELYIADNAEENDRQEALGTIRAAGTIIRASESSHDMYASIDALHDKLQSQLVKYKEKKKDHQHNNAKRQYRSRLLKEEQVKENDIQSLEKHYIPKPMDPEEAIEILESSDLNFFVFRDIKTERINIVYPLGSNNYGLIDP